MDEVELSPRRGLHTQVNSALSQNTEETGIPPSYDSGSRTRPSGTKVMPGQYNMRSEVVDSPMESEEPFKLPPKAYHIRPARTNVLLHVAYASAFVIGLGLPLCALLPILFSLEPSLSMYTGATFCTSIQSENQEWKVGYGFGQLLNISVAYGSLSFGTAKLVDLIWDIFVSRGGQLGLAYIAYKVHNAALLRIMEDSTVSYDLYATMTLSWATLWDLRPLVMAFFAKLGLKKKMLLGWVALSVIWIAIWPTITNAMTGYVAKNNTLVRLADDSGYANFTDMATNDNLAFQYSLVVLDPKTDNYSTVWAGPLLTKSGPNITLWTELEFTFTGYPFPSSSIYNSSLPGALRDENSTDLLDRIPAFVYYYYRNETYHPSWFELQENVQCVATSSYQWGFSASVLLIFTCINALWVTVTYAVWVHMNRKSDLCRVDRRLGKYRAAIDMTEAVHRSLGRDLSGYSNCEIERELRRVPGVKYTVTEGKEYSYIGLSSVNDNEKFRINYEELYGGSGAR